MHCARSFLVTYANLSPWLPEDTVDRVIIGDPEKPIRKMMVTWQANDLVLDYADGRGFDALMVHEPTFWFHQDEWTNVKALPEGSAKKRAALAKAAVLERLGLVVLRNHDAWDAMPGIGIPWAWAAHLGLSGPAATCNHDMQHRYDLPPVSLAELSSGIGRRTALLGDAPPVFFGDPEQIIRSVGIGTGCYVQLERFVAMGCDAAVICDDGCSYWHDIAWALEAGLALIRVSHGASEEPGMKALAAHAASLFPECVVEYRPFALRIH